MHHELRVQDPSISDVTFIELIADAAHEACSCHAMFAFASVAGIDALFSRSEVVELLQRGTMHLVVGVSAITNRAALERLAELEAAYENLTVEAFWDRDDEELFHPKLCVFDYADGRRCAIVGSGNLTPGGFGLNYEAFSIVRSESGEALDVSALMSFLTQHDAHLYPVHDDEVIARAERNIVRGGGGRGRRRRLGEADVVDVPEGLQEPDEEDRDVPDEQVVLVAEAPKSRGGWSQLQLNKDVLEQYFEIPVENGERITLRHRLPSGELAAPEHRSLIYSEGSNKNPKVEVGAAHRLEYPPEGRPIVIFRRLAPRVFEYVTRSPGEVGHEAIAAMLEGSNDSVGRGVTRVIRTLDQVLALWPECPIRPRE